MANNQVLNDTDERILNRRDDVNFKEHDIDDVPSVDRTHKHLADVKGVVDQSGHKKDVALSSQDRKHKPDIDGPQQESQETDDVYVDSREDDLPLAGKRVDELNAFDLSKETNKPRNS